MASKNEAMAVNEFIENLFKKYTKGPKAQVLKTHIDETFIKVKIFLLIQTLALLIFVCYPIYGFIVNNELIPLMPMQFPFIDQTTKTGFLLSTLIMIKMGVWAYAGSVGFDLFLARIIYNYSALVKLLRQDLVEYTEMCNNTSEYSVHYRNAFFRNFLIKCQDKDRLVSHYNGYLKYKFNDFRFIKFVNDTYADIIFKQFAMVYVSLIFSVFAIIRSNWYSGCGFFVFCLTEIYILCILGTTIKTEVIHRKIYNFLLYFDRSSHI